MVSNVLYHLENHPGGPNRNGIGLTFSDHEKNIMDLRQRGKYVYKVIEYKANSFFTNLITLGIRAGMITGYRYYMVNVNNQQYEPI
jgi:hypothetical protein